MGLLEFGLQVVAISLILSILFYIAKVQTIIDIFGTYYLGGLIIALVIAMIYKGLLTGHVQGRK